MTGDPWRNAPDCVSHRMQGHSDAQKQLQVGSSLTPGLCFSQRINSVEAAKTLCLPGVRLQALALTQSSYCRFQRMSLLLSTVPTSLLLLHSISVYECAPSCCCFKHTHVAMPLSLDITNSAHHLSGPSSAGLPHCQHPIALPGKPGTNTWRLQNHWLSFPAPSAP